MTTFEEFISTFHQDVKQDYNMVNYFQTVDEERNAVATHHTLLFESVSRRHKLKYVCLVDIKKVDVDTKTTWNHLVPRNSALSVTVQFVHLDGKAAMQQTRLLYQTQLFDITVSQLLDIVHDENLNIQGKILNGSFS